MEKVLDTSLRPDHETAGIHDPVKAQIPTLKRCCSIAQQLSALTGKLRSCKGDQSTWSPGRDEPTVAIGTGVYFRNLPSSQCLDSDCNIVELQNLFTLASVACEVHSSVRHRQLVKKRRTPRKVWWINGSSIVTNTNFRKAIPAAGASQVPKRQGTGYLNSGHCNRPSWLQESIQDTSALTSKPMSISNSSNTVILRFGSHHGPLGKKIMACPPKSSRITFTTVSKGNNGIPAFLSKPTTREIVTSKDTRVQGVAKRILQFIGDGSTAEKFIRGAFGNNPDTSKALRLLLTQRKVSRIGDGGRGKAFLYVATPVGQRELEKLKERDVISTDDNSSVPHHSNHCQDGLQMPLRDLTNCVTEAKLSETVLQAVLGKSKE